MWLVVYDRVISLVTLWPCILYYMQRTFFFPSSYWNWILLIRPEFLGTLKKSIYISPFNTFCSIIYLLPQMIQVSFLIFSRILIRGVTGNLGFHINLDKYRGVQKKSILSWNHQFGFVFFGFGPPLPIIVIVASYSTRQYILTRQYFDVDSEERPNVFQNIVTERPLYCLVTFFKSFNPKWSQFWHHSTVRD